MTFISRAILKYVFFYTLKIYVLYTLFSRLPSLFGVWEEVKNICCPCYPKSFYLNVDAHVVLAEVMWVQNVWNLEESIALLLMHNKGWYGERKVLKQCPRFSSRWIVKYFIIYFLFANCNNLLYSIIYVQECLPVFTLS